MHKMANSEKYLNILEEIEQENIDPMDLMTPNEVFDSIEMGDSAIEVIGYVEKFTPPFPYYKGDCPLILNNGNGTRVQVISWAENVYKVDNQFTVNDIIQLDGVYTREPPPNCNRGEKQYELVIHKNTIISKLGSYRSNNECTLSKPVYNKLSEVLNVSDISLIHLNCYIKSNFVQFFDSYYAGITCRGLGSITDGTYEIEVHFLNFNDDDYSKLAIYKGNRIQITGTIQRNSTGKPIYLSVNDISSIRKLKGHMSFTMLLKGYRILSERKLKEETS